MSKNIECWRITKKKYTIPPKYNVMSPFDGEGASNNPGRWNSKGTPMVYTTSSIALAILELIVNLEYEDFIINNYIIYSVVFTSDDLETIANTDLPHNWDADPPSYETRVIGDKWINSKSSLVYEVPSAPINKEINYLINPNHPSFNKNMVGKPEPLVVDSRLIKKINK